MSLCRWLACRTITLHYMTLHDTHTHTGENVRTYVCVCVCVCVSVPITGTSGRARTPSTAKRDRPEGQFRRRVKVFARGLALNLRHTGSVFGADSSLGLVEGRASEPLGFSGTGRCTVRPDLRGTYRADGSLRREVEQSKDCTFLSS